MILLKRGSRLSTLALLKAGFVLPGSDADRMVAICVHDCPNHRLPPGPFGVLLPDQTPLEVLEAPLAALNVVQGVPLARLEPRLQEHDDRGGPWC